MYRISSGFLTGTSSAVRASVPLAGSGIVAVAIVAIAVFSCSIAIQGFLLSLGHVHQKEEVVQPRDVFLPDSKTLRVLPERIKTFHIHINAEQGSNQFSNRQTTHPTFAFFGPIFSNRSRKFTYLPPVSSSNTVASYKRSVFGE